MKLKKEKPARQEKQLVLKTGLKSGNSSCNVLRQIGDYAGYGRCMAGGWGSFYT